MTDPRFWPTDDLGKCRVCERRHHPGWGCPKWRKWTEQKRQAWLDAHGEDE